jgi:hypothetical protein
VASQRTGSRWKPIGLSAIPPISASLEKHAVIGIRVLLAGLERTNPEPHGGRVPVITEEDYRLSMRVSAAICLLLLVCALFGADADKRLMLGNVGNESN